MHPYLLPHLMGGCVKHRVKRNLILRGDASAYLSRIFPAPGNLRRWSFYCWIKRYDVGSVLRGLIGTENSASYIASQLFFSTGDALNFYNAPTNTPGFGAVTFALFRDPTAWGALCIEWDSDNATATERLRIYWNGFRLAISAAPTLGADSRWNQACVHFLGRIQLDGIAGGGYHYGNFGLSEVRFVDGANPGPMAVLQLDGRSGSYMPRPYSGPVLSGNSFYLPFVGDAGDAPATATEGCKDRSGLGNHWTANGAIAVSDFVKDTPTNYRSGTDFRGNFATLNALQPATPQSGGTLSDGNLKTTTSGLMSPRANIPVPATGEYKFEAFINAMGSTSGYLTAGGSALYRADGTRWNGSAWVAYGAAYTTGDTIGCHINQDANTVEWIKNGVSQGVIPAPAGMLRNGSDSIGADTNGAWVVTFNFGQRAFNFPGAFPDTARPICAAALRSNVARPTTGFVQVNEAAASVQASLAANRAGWPAWVEWFKRTDSAEHWRMRFSDDPGNALEFSSTAVKAAFPALAGSYFGAAMRVGLEYGILTGTVAHATGAPTTVVDNANSVRKAIMLRSEAAGVAGRYYHPDLTPGSLLMLNATTAETPDTHITNVTANSFDIGAAAPTGTYRWFMMINTPGRVSVDAYQGNGVLDGPNPNWGFTAAMFFGKTRSSGVSSNNLWSMLLDPVNPVSNRLQLNADTGINPFAVGDVTGNGMKVRTTDTQNLNGAIVVTVAFAGFAFAPGECPAQATAR